MPRLAPCCLLLLFTFGAAPTAAAENSTKNPVLFTDFDGNGEDLANRLHGHPRLNIAKDAGPDGSDALHAKYVGYDRGSKRIVVRADLKKPGKAYTLCYDVRFDEDFQFVRGGKLHGLGPAKPIAGGRAMKPGGWSARVTFKGDGRLNSYVYHQNKSGKYGESVSSDHPPCQRGKWHAVSLYVKLNSTPAKADGLVRIYRDGEPLITHKGLRFRSRAGRDTLIREFMFSTFHGGHTPPWAPKNEAGEYVNVHARFDNIGVYPGEHVRKKPGVSAESHSAE